jgi:uncharacterized glyoxalase superfamily protein PhnB
MTGNPTTSSARAARPALTSCVPFLRVASAERALAFYRDRLGFTVEWTYPREAEVPNVVALRRDAVRLFVTEYRECAFGALAYCYVDDVDALARELAARGAAPHYGPVDQPWGTRELGVDDPDGNHLRFGQLLPA